MNCRIRFIRVDGREMQVGAKYNVVKDKSIDEPILRLVNVAKAFIVDQLRSFTRQDPESGRFEEHPEYPEFPWVEGIINTVAHRDYAASGQFIKVSMYDDRLEIESPGRFPDIVTADNITHTRFSRNKTISRVMTEFEWVRELNEGVKKICSDMEEAGLPSPEFIEMPNTVKLILRNNIDERLAYRNKASDNNQSKVPNRHDVGKDVGLEVGLAERIMELMRDDSAITMAKIAEHLGVTTRTIEREVKKLRETGRVERVGGKRYGRWQIND